MGSRPARRVPVPAPGCGRLDGASHQPVAAGCERPGVQVGEQPHSLGRSCGRHDPRAGAEHGHALPRRRNVPHPGSERLHIAGQLLVRDRGSLAQSRRLQSNGRPRTAGVRPVARQLSPARRRAQSDYAAGPRRMAGERRRRSRTLRPGSVDAEQADAELRAAIRLLQQQLPRAAYRSDDAGADPEHHVPGAARAWSAARSVAETGRRLRSDAATARPPSRRASTGTCWRWGRMSPSSSWPTRPATWSRTRPAPGTTPTATTSRSATCSTSGRTGSAARSRTKISAPSSPTSATTRTC